MTRILISGSAGFIGSHLVNYFFNNTDYEIVALVRCSTVGDLEKLPHNKRVKMVHHDLRSPIHEAISKKIGQVDYVAHLAACSDVDYSIHHPVEMVYDNVLGTVHLLDWANKQEGLIKFLNFSTDECFGPAPGDEIFDEWDCFKPSNPYAAGKSGAAEFAHAYWITYRLPTISTFSMNVYGPEQKSNKFIPLVIKKILNEEEVTIHADSTCKKAGSRYWIHANDVCRATHFALNHLNNGDRLNIAGYKEIDNLSVALKIAEVMGKDLKYKLVDAHSSRPATIRGMQFLPINF